MAGVNKSHEYETKTSAGEESGATETKDRGLFGFMGKKKEEVPATEYEEKIHRSDNSYVSFWLTRLINSIDLY